MTYYLGLAVHAFRRQWVFSALLVAIISIGIAASTSMTMVLHSLTADPLPDTSGSVFHPQIEPRVAGWPGTSGGLPDALMWDDAMNLLNAREGKRKAVMFEGQVTVIPDGGSAHSFFARALFSQTDFFSMFRVPFVRGAGWTPDDDARAARVVVISDGLARRVFGSTDAVGRMLRLGDASFRVTGVTDHWNPRPRFYDLVNGAFGDGEEVFMPFSTSRALSVEPGSSPVCWGEEIPDMGHLERAPCTWVTFWVELETASERDNYLRFLRSYVAQQKASGRFYGEPRVGLSNVTEWIAANHVVPTAARMQSFMAYSFLAVCMFNAAGLLMVMFLRRRRELGLRRALGATRRQVFQHLLAETSGLALASGISGLLLTRGVLGLFSRRPEPYYANVVMDVPMIATGLLMAFVATGLATCVPAWQVARGNPHAMLNS